MSPITSARYPCYESTGKKVSPVSGTQSQNHTERTSEITSADNLAEDACFGFSKVLTHCSRGYPDDITDFLK